MTHFYKYFRTFSFVYQLSYWHLIYFYMYFRTFSLACATPISYHSDVWHIFTCIFGHLASHAQNRPTSYHNEWPLTYFCIYFRTLASHTPVKYIWHIFTYIFGHLVSRAQNALSGIIVTFDIFYKYFQAFSFACTEPSYKLS